MKKIFLICITILALLNFTGCSTRNKKITQKNIDLIQVSITNGSIYKFKETNKSIKGKNEISEITHDFKELELSNEKEVKDTGGLVGASTYKVNMTWGSSRNLTFLLLF